MESKDIEDKEYVLCPSDATETKYRSYPIRWYVLTVSCVLALSNAAIWISYSTVNTHIQMFYCNNEYFKQNGSIMNSEDIELLNSNTAPLGDCNVAFWTNQIFQIVGTVFGLAGIIITDKCGILVSIYCGAITNLIGILLRTISAIPKVSISGRIGLLYTGQTIAAMSQPFFLVLSPKIAEFWFADNQRALANALSFAANPAGVVLGTVAPELIIHTYTTRNASNLLHLNILLLAFATIVMAMVFGVRSSKPPTPPSASSASNHSPPFLQGLLSLFKIPIFYVQMVTLGMPFALCWGFFMGFEPMMTALKYNFVGYASALAAIAGFVSSIIAGYFVDKTKRFKEVIKGAGGCIAIVAISINIYLRHANNHWYDSYILGFLMVLLGLFAILTFPIGLELGIETTYPIAEATSSGVLIIAGQIMLFIVNFIIDSASNLSWFYSSKNQPGHENDDGDLIFERNYSLAVDAWTALSVISAIFTFACLWPKYKRIEYENAAIADSKENSNENSNENSKENSKVNSNANSTDSKRAS